MQCGFPGFFGVGSHFDKFGLHFRQINRADAGIFYNFVC